MPPIVLKTKYAFHALLWQVRPDLVMDVGSMDGSDSIRFRSLLKSSTLLAFEANPDNFERMQANKMIDKNHIQVVNSLVSQTDGMQSFFIQRPDNSLSDMTNKGTSSALPRLEAGMQNIEVHVPSVRLDSFIEKAYPAASSIALWIDVEGFAFDVLESIDRVANRISIIHVEVETRECWPGQHLEPEVVQLLSDMGFILLAQGKHPIQRDLIFIRADLYSGHMRNNINRMLTIARRMGPTLSRCLAWFPR